jgi:hypothetical protein
MDKAEPMAVLTAQPSATTVDPTDTGSKFWDWFLFGVTLIGAAIVYISMFMESPVGFVVGEALCLSVALVGIGIKYWHKRQVAAGLAKTTN